MMRRMQGYEGFPFMAKQKSEHPECPECGEEVSEFYVNRRGDIVGCEFCVHPKDAWEMYGDED